MEWFSRSFEVSTNEIPGRRYSGRYGGSTALMRPFPSISVADEGRGKHVIGHDYQLREDEHLAKVLQESLNLDHPLWNQNGNGNGYRPTKFPHSTGFNENHHPRCDVCKNFIQTNAAGVAVYKANPFWGQKYCVSHERDGTPRCCSCERMETKDTRYVALGDGRKLCLECLDSAIMDTTECQPLYLDIKKFYEGMNMKVEQNIPLLLVERQALNEAMDGETNGHHHMRETRGLCLSEEQTITTVLRQPRIGMGNWAPNMRTEPYKLTRHCEVTAILILHGLPRLLTGTILAHEMMHAWMRLNGYPPLRQDVEEGICQVVAHMWLTSQISGQRQGKRFELEKKVGEFFKYQIESDRSQAYGDGFRAGNRAVVKHGLQKTLHQMRLTGSFPF